MSDSNKLFIIITLALGGWLFYLLSSVLMPFFVSALLAYLGDPIVDKLEEKKLSRTVSVSIVFAILSLATLAILLILLPMLVSQIAALFKRLPDYLTLIHSTVMPWLTSMGFPTDSFDINIIKQAIANYWAEIGKVAGGIVSYMTQSGMVLIQWLVNLILIPVVTFYLLRDWDLLVIRFRELLPRSYAKKVIALSCLWRNDFHVVRVLSTDSSSRLLPVCH